MMKKKEKEQKRGRRIMRRNARRKEGEYEEE